jgi:hypothetical protein
MSAYLGVAEAARELALQHLHRKRDDPEVWYLVGEPANALATADLAVQGMVELWGAPAEASSADSQTRTSALSGCCTPNSRRPPNATGDDSGHARWAEPAR